MKNKKATLTLAQKNYIVGKIPFTHLNVVYELGQSIDLFPKQAANFLTDETLFESKEAYTKAMEKKKQPADKSQTQQTNGNSKKEKE